MPSASWKANGDTVGQSSSKRFVMNRANSRRGVREVPAFPSDREVREALVRSGMRPPAVGYAMSQLLRLLRWDFGRRRKRRLYNLTALRIGMVQLKEKVFAIVARYREQAGTPINLEDLLQGEHAGILIDFGLRDVERAARELMREGVLRVQQRGVVDVIQATRKRYEASVSELRRVLDQIKLHLNIRYAAGYSSERTYRL